MSEALKDILVPAETALLVIDLQRDFVSDEGALARWGTDMALVQAAVPAVNRLIDAARAAGIFTVYTRNVYAERSFQANQEAHWGPFEGFLTREGTPGAELIPDLRSPEPDEVVLVKRNYDAFHATELDLLLRARGTRTTVLVGVDTNVCVESTARHAYFLGYHVVVVADATGAASAAEHEAALFTLRTYFGFTPTADEVLQAWGARWITQSLPTA